MGVACFDGNDDINGLGGNDYLIGGAGDDMLNGGVGNDTMWGQAGHDTFQFTDLHFGRDSIIGFQLGTDKLEFSSNIATSMADFTITGQGTNTIVLNHGVDSVTIHSPTASHLSASDFIFV